MSFLALGFLIGLRHALEPDHVAAVVSLSTRGGSLGQHARRGALWGVGHALTLLLLAGTCVVLGVAVPERAGAWLEAAVGMMLIGLGVSVLVRLARGGATPHAREAVRDAREADAASGERPGARAVLVGAVHGLAGSAALVLLVGQAARTPALGLVYIALFGLGAVVGMMLLAATLSVPLGASARYAARLYRGLCASAGAISVVLGTHLIWLMTR